MFVTFRGFQNSGNCFRPQPRDAEHWEQAGWNGSRRFLVIHAAAFGDILLDDSLACGTYALDVFQFAVGDGFAEVERHVAEAADLLSRRRLL